LARAAKLPTASDDDVVAAAKKVMREAKTAAILATRSDKGMVLVEASGATHVEPARAREVFDVSGAGDTVVAVLALAHAAGLALPDAEVETLARQWKSRGLDVGFTNGCFDIVHPGHVGYLAAARAQCDRLIVALNSDASTRRLKGPTRPVNRLTDRMAVIAGLASVDAVISFDEDTPIDLIRRLKPDVLLKGADYTFATVVGAEDVVASGGRVALIDLVEGHSTTGVIGRMQAPVAALAGKD
jgi:D-beta-D-heptose 7-phosphate kinase/D-beta-D-heptose 1-phosphate adenosyltransferase